MDRLIRLEPSNNVTIRVEPGQRCSGELTLRNVMYTMPVAFRLQPVDRTRYDIRPQSGIIAPLATLTVEITYIYQHGTTTIPESDDSFLLHSVVVPGASSSSSPLPNDWFTTKKKQVFVDSGIRISFVGSVVLVKLVAEGAMEKLREALEISEPEWRPADAVDSHGQTLLHLAIARKRPDLVQLLLEFDPNVSAPNLQGRSPLEAAAAAGDALVAELLLARGASTERQEKPNSNSAASPWGPLHHAVARGHVEVMRLLLLKGAAVNALTGDGRTVLHLAAGERRLDCARLLLAAGAKSDSSGGAEGDTPLHVAAAAGDEGMVRLLLSRGVAGLKDVRSRAGRTAYDKAAEAGHTRLFDALRLGDGLCMAARKGEAKAAGRLVERGAAVNGRDQYGWTALMRAGFKGRTEMMRALLEKGAEVDARDEEGYTALHCAAEAGQTEAVEVLLKRGADVDAMTAKGATAMQIAGSLGYAGVARILAQGGASRDGAPPVEGGGGVAPAAVAAENLVAAAGLKSKVAERKARSGRSRLGGGGAATVGGTAMAVH